MSILTEALLKQLSSLDMPILILPSKKKVSEEDEIEEIGTRLSRTSSLASSPRIPSSVPG